jgi:hypothetical protein
VFIHFEPLGRSLKDVDAEDMKYNMMHNPGGYEGEVLLPPYVIPGSPEASEYIQENPRGWNPDFVTDDSDSDDYDEGTENDGSNDEL